MKPNHLINKKPKMNSLDYRFLQKSIAILSDSSADLHLGTSHWPSWNSKTLILSISTNNPTKTSQIWKQSPIRFKITVGGKRMLTGICRPGSHERALRAWAASVASCSSWSLTRVSLALGFRGLAWFLREEREREGELMRKLLEE